MSFNAVQDVSRFQLSFFAMCRLNSFPWKALETTLQDSSSGVILDILRNTCLHSVCRTNPPSVKYRRLFLCELIKRHEATGAEPLDELYDALAEVMSAEDETVCFKTYFLPSGEPVSLEENVAMISGGTTGLVTWEAALYLTEWALENTQVFAGRTVLELGSGAGLTGVSLCRACKPKKYVFTDCHQGVLQRLRNNLERNGLNQDASVRELDWERAQDEELKRIGAETVVAAGTRFTKFHFSCAPPENEFLRNGICAPDVVYDPDVVVCLVRLLARLFGVLEDAPEVYVASTIRNPGTYARFKDELEKAGLKHVTVPNPVTQVFPYDRVSSLEIINVFKM